MYPFYFFILSKIGLFQKDHNTLCCPFKILHKHCFNPFAPEPPVRIQVLSTLFDVISFYGQGQLSPLTCAE